MPDVPPPEVFHFYPASNAKRFVAFLIDMVVAWTGALLFVSLLSGFDKIGLVSLLVLLYFVIMHAAFGFTLGKKLMGLRLIRYGDDEKAGVLQVVFRETIGKFISTALFFGGFLFIFFSKERIALHDKICRTHVISDEPEESVSSLAVFAQGFAVVAVFMAGIFYTAFHTSIPLKSWAKHLKKSGVQIEGVHGSLKDGFLLETIKFTNKDLEFTGKDIVFKYDNIFDLVKGKDFHIRRISASQVHLAFHKNQSSATSAQRKRARQANAAHLENQEKSENRSTAAANILCDLIDVSEIKVSMPDEPAYEAKKLQVKKIMLSKGNVEVQKIYLDSKDIFTDIQGFSYDKVSDVFSISESEVIVKKSMFPKYLSGDIDLKIKGSANLGTQKFVNLVLSGFRNSFSLSYENDMLDIKTANFQPQWYFKNLPPAHTFNVEFKGDAGVLWTAPFQGWYKLGVHQVNLEQKTVPGSVFQGQISTFSGSFNVGMSFHLKQNPESPVQVHLSSFENYSVGEAVSKILFRKPIDEFTEADRMTIYQNSPYFTFKTITPSLESIIPFDQRMQMELQQRSPANNW